jgi:hypothetical protein
LSYADRFLLLSIKLFIHFVSVVPQKNIFIVMKTSKFVISYVELEILTNVTVKSTVSWPERPRSPEKNRFHLRGRSASEAGKKQAVR